jgi:glycosyltransferase involved in cell wall biosynthesis
MDKLISIIVPCYNAVAFIDRCIQSLVNQTIGIDNLELILVNDASTDDTLQYLMNWEEKYPNSILVVNCEENGKQGTARNIGISYASCEYIGFVDSDDWVELDMYEKLYDKAKELNCDMVGCMADRINNPSEIKKDAVPGEDRFFYSLEDNNRRLEYLKKGIGEHIMCKIYRKSIITENSIYFPEHIFYEDNYWSALIDLYVHSAYMINEVLYHWYVNVNSTSMRRNDTTHLDRLYIEKLKVKEFKERGLYEKFQAIIDRNFLFTYYINSMHLFFLRYDFFPIELFRGMQLTVMEYVPDYYKVEGIPAYVQCLLDLINLDITQEDLNDIQKAYIKTMTEPS